MIKCHVLSHNTSSWFWDHFDWVGLDGAEVEIGGSTGGETGGGTREAAETLEEGLVRMLMWVQL